MVPMRLSPEQRQEAARMYRDELSARQIAQHFGCSVNAVRNALMHEGVVMRGKVEASRLRDKFPSAREAQREAMRQKWKPRPKKAKPLKPPKAVPAVIPVERPFIPDFVRPLACGFVFDLGGRTCTTQ